MRILHFADLHLGVETYGHTDPATGLSSRLGDFLAALDQLVDYAINNHVDLVLFCGDAYKTREPSQTQQREFARRINRLSSADIPTFLLVGNHDLPNAVGRATATEIFDTLAVKNVYVSSRPDVYRIPTRSGIVQVASLPWLRRSALLTREECKDLTFEQVKQKLEEALTAVVAASAAKLDPALPAVLAAHVWVAGAQVGSERLTMMGHEHTLLLSNIALPAFDYVALGHFHRHQVLNAAPPVVYSGSLERVDFGEENDDKGFYLVDIETLPDGRRQTSFEFHPIAGRRFLSITVDIQTDDITPTETALKVIASQAEKIRDAVVRLTINIPAHLESQLRDNDLKGALKEANYSTISRNVQREARMRLGKWTTEELTPLDALKAYLESKKVSPERERLLMEYGERLIQSAGEEGR